ncbi:MAG TPA: hypothetical protein VII92_13325, partial [Anaerolineae bacterium]
MPDYFALNTFADRAPPWSLARLDANFTELSTELSRRAISVHAAEFNAIGDGASHPLSERYITLSEAREFYPFAQALTDEIDWCAIQKAINTITTGAIVLKPGAVYRTNHILWIGNFTSSGTGGGFTWDGETRYWGGNIANTKSYLTFFFNGARISWNGASSLPMFIVIGCDNIAFDQPWLIGNAGSVRASEGIWYAGSVCWQYTVRQARIFGTKRGIRLGDKQHWTEDPVTFTSYWPAHLPAIGGWSIEYGTLSNLFVQEVDVGISLESNQIINCTIEVPGIAAADYGVFLHSGRVRFLNPVFGGSSDAAIYCAADMGVVELSIYGGHNETSNDILLQKAKIGTTEGGNYIPHYTVTDFDNGRILLGGAFSLTVINSRLAYILADTNTNTNPNATQSIGIHNATITERLEWAQTGTTNWVLSNVRFVDVTAAITNPFTNNNWFLSNWVLENVTFSGAAYTAQTLARAGTYDKTSGFIVEKSGTTAGALLTGGTIAHGMGATPDQV